MRLRFVDPGLLAAVGFLLVGVALCSFLVLDTIAPGARWNPLALILGSFHSAQTADYRAPDVRPVAPQKRVETAGAVVRVSPQPQACRSAHVARLLR